ncbi:hypothetical protein PR048_012673 [Dryococelus australis]|uniref:Uncharacterized protein n=1 Tax=Dryococelus australis TaxID=614101 RepID=A0ABQ9HQF2_9NEOP|nr:hypothetical protein PR048_012673 [Dryococelus australis]
MFNCILCLLMALITMTSKLIVEGKELDLLATLHHLASRLEGLAHENLELNGHVGHKPVHLNGDRSDLLGTVYQCIFRFFLADSTCQVADTYKELKKHLLECFGRKYTTLFYMEQPSHLKIMNNTSVEEFTNRIHKINTNTYELGPNNE